MTMHGAKGLSADVVFIPGLEETVFPTVRQASKPGLVLEGARLLYVSLTRAKAAVFCSYTVGRLQNGAFVNNVVSRYAPHLGLQVQHRNAGLSSSEVSQVAATCAAL
jgi:DNA helicase-2/ATP-dependent DNA helicase PcrA